LLILLLGGVQPRYMFPIWLVVSGVIGIAAARCRPRQPLFAGKRLLAGLVTVGLTIGVGFVMLRAAYDVANGRIIGEWDRVTSHNNIQSEELTKWFKETQLGLEPGVAGRGTGRLSTTLRLPAARGEGADIAVMRRVCRGGEGRRGLTFFLHAPGGAGGDARLTVRADKAVVYESDLAQARSVVLVEIDDLFGGRKCVDLALRLAAGAGTNAGTAPVIARIYYPRLFRPAE